MEFINQRFYIVSAELDGKKYFAHCEDEDVKPGDLVAIDGFDRPLEVVSGDYYGLEDLSIPLEDMLKVKALAKVETVSKRSQSTIDEVTESEFAIQEKEESEESASLEEEKASSKEEIKEGEEEESIDPETLSISLDIDSSFSLISYETDLTMRIFDPELNRRKEKTGYEFVKELKLNNRSEKTLRGLSMVFSFSSPVLSCEPLLLPAIDYQEEAFLRMPFIKVDKKRLFTLDAPEVTSLHVDLVTQKGTVLSSVERSFILLPIGEVNHMVDYDYRLWAKFVTPEAMEVKQVTLDATEEFTKHSFIGYQCPSWNERAEEIAAIYATLAKKKISYQLPPNNIAKFQKVRLPPQVLLDHKGTCLDLSFLLCSALEEIGYHPILIVLDGHALIGVFLEGNDTFENARCTKVGAIWNRATGKRDILLLDAVDICDGLPFQKAIENGLARLDKYSGRSFEAIDIVSAHKSIFLPILTRSNDELDPSSLYNRATDTYFEPIIETKYNEVRHEVEKDRFTFWENKLLDLTEKNPLVHFRFNPNNFVVLVKKNLLEHLYSEQPLPLSFVEASSDRKAEELIEEAFHGGYSALPPGSDPNGAYLFGKPRNFRLMLSKNQSEVEETGAPTLYLCMGLLTFAIEDSKRKRKVGHAPFMLLPIKIEKRGYGSSTFTMVYDYDNAMVNKTFFEYYKNNHEGFDISPLYHTSKGGADRYEDLVLTFKDKVKEDISLDENCFYIANLTFAHYIMWTDMSLRKEQLRKNPIVASIVSGESVLDPAGLDIAKIEESEHYRDFAAPLPYDSTQLSAILKAAEGKSFILDGPPGTGKSQTIVNMIVNAIYHGKTVLFVAEKKAALDVVADRLRKIKLDRFCMELHSTKANKKDFFGRLNESMRLGPTAGEGNFLSTVNSLEFQKQKILEMIQTMHEAKQYCLSFFEAITLDLNLGNKFRPIPYPKELIASCAREDYFKGLDFLNQFTSTLDSYGGIAESKLWRCRLNFFSTNSIEEAARDFSELEQDIEQFIYRYNALFSGARLNLPLVAENVVCALKAYELAFDPAILKNEAEKYFLLDENTSFSYVFERARELSNKRKELSKYYDPNKLQLIDSAGIIESLSDANRGLLKKISDKRFAKKTLQNAAKSSKSLPNKDLLEEFKRILDYQALYEDVQDSTAVLRKYLGHEFINDIEDFEKPIAQFEATFRFINAVKRVERLPGGNEASDFFLGLLRQADPSCERRYGLTMEALKTLQENEARVFEKYSISKDDFSVQGQLPLDLLLQMLEEGKNEEEARKLVYIASANNFALENQTPITAPIIAAFRKGLIPANELGLAYEGSFAKEVIRLYFDNNRLINDFHPNVYDAELEKYRSLIQDYSSLIIEEVTTRATKKLTHGRIEYKDSSPIGRLKTIASSGGRGMTIRQALEKFDSIIHAYFPVFLMSPLSAAQYLSVEGESATSKFDLVIFDEASQIPVHEAVGPIARGKSLIVAGDPKQMPPTTYFTVEQALSIDELEYQDASSLLDECIAISFPQIRLSYHYRSRHESLIDFSNKNFYGDELHTFPAPTKGKRAIRFERVVNKEAKSDSKMTKEEIGAILTRLNLIYSDEENQKKSVGIIVFNLKQKESLEKALETYLEKERKLAQTIAKAGEATGEPLFIKSIENVQGDERDIIILCIGFRKSLAGKAVITGPLAISGGERRLNVAISRSKERMYIISTITDDDFDGDSYVNSKGALLLKHFLAYARNEEEASWKENLEKGIPSRLTIADFLRKDLEQEGYLCDMNVGESKNKVDIAIRGEQLNTYVLGILIDDDSEVSGATLRDKEYVEPSVFNHLNWKIIKVYAVSYYKNKAATIERIKSALEKPFVKMEEKIEPKLEAKEVDISYQCYDYVKVDMDKLDPISYAPDKGFSREINMALRRLIEVEGPLCLSLIKSRVKEKAGLFALSPLASIFLDKELSPFEEYKDSRGFYWAPNSLRKLPAFRKGGDRDITEIPYEEFECAFIQILARQGELSQDDLYKAALEAFEYGAAKLTKKNRDYLDSVYAIFKERRD